MKIDVRQRILKNINRHLDIIGSSWIDTNGHSWTVKAVDGSRVLIYKLGERKWIARSTLKQNFYPYAPQTT